MDLPFPWTFVLFTLCFVALIAGALLGFAVGFRTGGDACRYLWINIPSLAWN